MTERKRARIEYDKESEIHQANLRREIEKNSELQQQLKYVVDEEKNVREELRRTRKEFDEYKKKSEERIHGLQQQKMKMNSEMEGCKESSWRQLAETREQLKRQETENVITQNKLEYSENKLDYYKKLYSEVSKHVEELQQSHTKCEGAEHRVKELEEKLARCEEAAEVAMTMQSQISKYYKIECENSKLKEENAYLKATNKSNLLLKEKLYGCENKLKRAEEKLKNLSQVEVECERQRAFMRKWEVEGVDTTIGSPDELLQEISRLQKAQVVLLQKHGQASTSARISSEGLRLQSQELLDLKLRLSDIEEKYKEKNEQMKRLNKLLSLVTTERNGCRRLLSSYDSGDSTNYATQLTSRVQHAEEQLQACNSHIEKLENDLKMSIERNSEETIKYNKLKIEYDVLMKQSDVVKGRPSNLEQEKLQEVIEKLQLENKELLEKLEILQTRIEQRNLQGDFDPSKVKVVHFSQNPFTHARQLRTVEVQHLRDECEKLRKKVKALEEDDKLKPSKVEQIVIDESSPSEVRDLQAQVSSAERKNKRLKEVFAQKIQEFREACYSMTGYRVDVVQDQQYKLQSMYAERSSDHLLFQCNANGKTMLLETDFSLRVKNLIDQYLMQCNSIPAFLSSVTLELFERQTQMMN
ncbi:mitotic spindle assembly checkpoint protein MAD1-like [Dendronephthya gigantea]|uniref:mitotic spindle assembly checkpoint protein MAD1-like n=1 Tax=Dendronephthya gigantea TaxID=151771 RepID=UPI00106BFEA4|nr:mitotic spindle assembly checkpoint protein MAD1-like [Dendronephthya gigantea]